jgi:hypothetical protein
MQVTVNRKDIKFLPDSSRIIARFLYMEDERALFTIRSVLNMSDSEASTALKQVLRYYSMPHRNISKIFERHFDKIAHLLAHFSIDPELLE